MKSLFTIITLICCYTYTCIGQVNFESDFRQTCIKAQKEDKPIFVFCYRGWHERGRELPNKVLATPELAGFLNKNFVNLKLDLDKIKKSDQFPIKDIRNMYTPTFLFLKNKKEIIHKLERRDARGVDVINLDAKNIKKEAEKALSIYF